MKLSKKRVAAFALALLMLVLTFSSCAKKKSPGNTVSIGYNSGRLDMIVDSSDEINCDYLLVYNDTAGGSEIDACIDLLEQLTLLSTDSFQICPDTLVVPSSKQKIILLGNTSYKASVKTKEIMDCMRKNNYYDYIFRSTENVISVNWVSKFGREEAIKYLTEHLLDEGLEKLFNTDYTYMYLSQRSDSPVVTIDDVNITQYTIIIPEAPSYMERQAAINLQEAIKLATGTEIPLLSDKAHETTYEILIGDTSRGVTYVTDFFTNNRYAIVQHGTKLILRGGQIESTSVATNHFADMITNSVITAEPVHVKANYCKTGNIEAYSATLHDGYNLVYADEFNGDKLDDKIWRNTETTRPAYGIAPALMYYNPESVSMDGRHLSISTHLSYDGYVSGKVDTCGKLSFKYGYVEVRAKFRTAPGYWAKLMLTDYDERLESVSQIDVFNSLGSNNLIFGSAGSLSRDDYYENYLEFNDVNYDLYCPGTLESGQVLNGEDYHTFGVEWDEDHIRYFIDGVPYGMVEITDGKYELLKKELYLSFFIGVEMTPEKTNDECAQWPLDFDVDWVRVYQREGSTVNFGTVTE